MAAVPGEAPRREPTRRDAVETRRRLLEAAGETFADHGYHEASLRAICDRAGVNLGSIKYYFGSKDALYREVLYHTHAELMERERMPRLEDAAEPADALEAWIDWYLDLVLLGRARHPYLGRIMIRELVQPSGALDELVGRLFIHVRAELERIVAAVGEGLTGDALTRATNMTLMLCVQHEIGKPVLVKIGYRPPETRAEVSALARSVCAYAAGGIRSVARAG